MAANKQVGCTVTSAAVAGNLGSASIRDHSCGSLKSMLAFITGLYVVAGIVSIKLAATNDRDDALHGAAHPCLTS